MSNKNTLWNGRREWDVNALNALVPATGEVKGKENAALEAYRKFSNVYYEIFNNGCFNWQNYGATYRALAKAHGLTPYCVSTIRARLNYGGDLLELETLGDKIIDAALNEQADALRNARMPSDA